MNRLRPSLPSPTDRCTRLWVGSLLSTMAMCASSASLPAPDSQDVAAGKYLADAAHCSACHTSRADRPFAGNVPIPSKFGTMYSSNITPDPATGIGRWNETEFAAALRLGRGRHGTYLYPSMPYTDFTKVSDADVHSLWLYFRNVTPVVEKVKANTMKFPFNVRPGIAAWQALYFRPGRYVADASRSEEWNRGAYLVEGLGHCGACHTPKNFAMADRKDHALQGAETGDYWFAPNIGSGPRSGIGDWSIEQVATYLRTGHNEKNVAAVGPMLETIAQGTRKLSDGDLTAIAVYLKNQEPQEAAKTTPPAALSEDRRAAGGAIYSAHCAACHGDDGKGLDGVAPALAGNSLVTSPSADNVVHSVLTGFAPNGRWGAMPSFALTLDSQQVADVANYLRSSWGASAPANATTSGVNRMLDSVAVGDARIQPALLCPAVPVADVDPVTLAQIATLVNASGSDKGAARLLRSYRQRHPGVADEQATTVLTGAYCRDLMARHGSGSEVDKQARVVDFMARLAAQGHAIR